MLEKQGALGKPLQARCVSFCRFALMGGLLHAVAWGNEHTLTLPALPTPPTATTQTDAASTKAAIPGQIAESQALHAVANQMMQAHEGCLQAQMREASLAQMQASALDELTLQRLQAWSKDEVRLWCRHLH